MARKPRRKRTEERHPFIDNQRDLEQAAIACSKMKGKKFAQAMTNLLEARTERPFKFIYIPGLFNSKASGMPYVRTIHTDDVTGMVSIVIFSEEVSENRKVRQRFIKGMVNEESHNPFKGVTLPSKFKF